MLSDRQRVVVVVVVVGWYGEGVVHNQGALAVGG
jgi:hypothetical protein